jgi:nucleoside-diphosphate-sugar epimerase
MKIIITGGNGYIGSRLSSLLSDEYFQVLKLVRNQCINTEPNINCRDIGDFCDITDWSEFISGADCIIHLASKAHDTKNSHSGNLALLKKINCDMTLNLASSASKIGVKRFIYISSIGVLGETSTIVNIFDNNSSYNPKNAYSVSKMEAEIGLKKISKDSKMEVVIIRPPLVFGVNAPGNFNRLLKLVDLGIPLPFKMMKNKKNMISLDNLCDLITRTVTVPLPKLSVFVVTDGSNWSTAELVVLIAKYMGQKNLLFSITAPILMVLASLVGKRKEILKLKTSLQVDGSKTAKILNWSPLQLPENGVEEAVKYYLIHKKNSRQKN